MAIIPITTHSRPTLNEFVTTCREAGRPQELLSRVTREDVLAACLERDIPVKDGRIELSGPTDVAAIYFALRSRAIHAPR